jgi:1,4-dihydroxy-6-naphthoate synthase
LTPLRIGISPCPNDTFAFHAIMERRIDLRGLAFEFELLDVQALNDGLFAGRYDLAKASFHAALLLADRYGVLRAGSALGFGVGPLLVASDAAAQPSPQSRVLCPGATTTGTLLYRCLHPGQGTITHTVFSEIGPQLHSGKADLGVLIHEGRLTYDRDGLVLVEDLGASFERLAQAPIPLGGILARLDLPERAAATVSSLIQESIAYGWQHRQDVLPTIRAHAQEMGEDVIWPYVELYVTDHTIDLGEDGTRALATLETVARRAGVLDDVPAPLRVLG